MWAVYRSGWILIFEPLRNLLGRSTRLGRNGLPPEIVWRQPFPGRVGCSHNGPHHPGTRKRREVNAIVTDEIEQAGLDKRFGSTLRY